MNLPTLITLAVLGVIVAFSGYMTFRHRGCCKSCGQCKNCHNSSSGEHGCQK